MIWVRKGDWKKEFSLVMLDEYEYRVFFPPTEGGLDKYKIGVGDNSILTGLEFYRKFSRLPKEFKQAVLLIQVFYSSGGFGAMEIGKRAGHFNAGWFFASIRSGDWTEANWDVEDGGMELIKHGPSFYLTFKTGKYPNESKYPTKEEYQQMKRKK